MKNELDRIVKEELKRPKFLAHVIFPDHKYEDKEFYKDNSPKRHDMEIYTMLMARKSLEYRPVTFTDEFAFSLHTRGSDYCRRSEVSEGNYGYLTENSQGLIIFNDKFYEAICSRNVDDSMFEKIKEEMDNLHTSKGFYNWNSRSEISGSPKVCHRFLYECPKGSNDYHMLECLARYRADKIKEFNQWLEFKGMSPNEDPSAKEPLLVSVNIIDKLSTLKKYLRSINSLDVSDAIKSGIMGYRIKQAIDFIVELRKEKQRTSDIGVRAVNLSPQGDLNSLPIKLEDIRYFFSYGNERPSSAKMLISPENRFKQ
jgi:hypothetical protein